MKTRRTEVRDDASVIRTTEDAGGTASLMMRHFEQRLGRLVIEMVGNELPKAKAQAETQVVIPGGPVLEVRELQAAYTQAVQRILDAAPVRRFDAAKAKLESKAIDAIFAGTEWLTADELGRQHNPNARNPHSVVSRWRTASRIFGVEKAGKTLFARYQFDELWEPRPAVGEVLAVFKDYSPLRIASWFESTNSMLDAKRPRSLLARIPQKVIAAARDHALGPVHG